MSRDQGLRLLTEAEFQGLVRPERINIGSYYPWKEQKTRDFIIDLDARPLAALAEDAANGMRVYEFMSIRRPGDIHYYVWARYVVVDHDIEKYVEDSRLSLLAKRVIFLEFAKTGLNIYFQRRQLDSLLADWALVGMSPGFEVLGDMIEQARQTNCLLSIQSRQICDFLFDGFRFGITLCGRFPRLLQLSKCALRPPK